MKYIPIALLLTIPVFLSPEPTHESVAYKRMGKMFHDRIEVGVEPVRVQRCKTPGTIWHVDACYRPERLPHD